MLSGFIFSHVYGETLRLRRVSGWSFFVRRFARLYPVHLLMLCVTAVLVYAFHAQLGRFPVFTFNSAQDFVANLFFLQDGILSKGYSFDGPAWSLSIEAMLYVGFFVMARRGMRLEWAYAAMALGVVFLLSDTLQDWRPPMYLSRDIPRGLIGFALGILIDRCAGRPAPFLALAAGLGLAELPAPLPAIPLQLALTWTLFGLLLVALQRSQLLRRLLEQPVLVWLGDISLSIYLVHFPVQVALMLASHWLGASIPYRSPLFLAFYAATVLAAAAAMHFWFERPAQAFLRARLAGARLAPPQAA